MEKYLLIESRNPFDSTEVTGDYQLAQNLVNNGHEVILYLVENGVFGARSKSTNTHLSQIKGVKIFADEFSLKERGIQVSELYPAISPGSLNTIIEWMIKGHKTIWF